ncbi:CAP domain-containing protein [Enterococcus alishanensis]|uniref:Uncharacterized protein n=1 Tax=Enterococcus alishanensis TaxID=1303817 RepID=A0ABS6TDQ8_9ENTE|nr:CAP domain-containing protein [Enterococcus alishanensis]MBV7391032.1 hypothetical protein [Enterococcus alishanensis]
MKRKFGLALVVLGAFGLFTASSEASADTDMLRVYNPNSGEHFYTGVPNERDGLVRAGWDNEGLGWRAPSSGDRVYRLYNRNEGDHHYTLDVGERDWLIGLGWEDEGTGWFSDRNKGEPLLRLYNPNAKTGSHHYTHSTGERDSLVAAGWRYEGVGWYGVEQDTATSQSIEAQFLTLLNDYRAQQNLGTLTSSTLLKEAARIRTVELLDVYGEERPDGRDSESALAEVGYTDYTAYGYNIIGIDKTTVTNTQQVAQATFDELIADPVTREVIVYPVFNEVGISFKMNDNQPYTFIFFATK